MGVAVRHRDFDKELEKLDGKVIFVNDLDPINDGELKNRLTVTIYDSSTFSLIPCCSCGMTTTETHPEKQVGDRCDYCFTEIHTHTSRKLESNVWMRAPEGIPSLINPRFLWVMIETFKIQSASSSIIHWLMDPLHKEYKRHDQIKFMEEKGVKRGMVYFLENFEYILELLKHDIFNRHPDMNSQFQYLYHKDKEILFPKHLPMPHKSFNIVEKTPLGNFAEIKTFNAFVDAVNTMMGLDVGVNPPSLKKKESIVARTLFLLISFYVDYIKENHNSKKGDYRKLIYGASLPWTGRMVITSLTKEHEYDEVHFPWTAAIPLLEIHITNKLIKKGYTPNQIKAKIHRAVSNYDEEIALIIDQMIQESPHRTAKGTPGLMLIVNRNPSLKMGAIQSLIVTRVKEDPTDISLSLSVLVLKAYGGDFDGDELNLMLVNDTYQAASLIKFAPHNATFSTAEYNKLSGDVALPKQMNMILSNWIEEDMEDEELYRYG